MANTFHQLYAHIVFAVKKRQAIIPKNHKEELHRYITGIVKERDQKLLAIGSMPDHLHLLVNFKPTCTLSNLVADVKAYSSYFISQKQWIPYRFAWQDGYGIFTNSNSEIEKVIDYILNQEEHHQNLTFESEYRAVLKRYAVPFDEKYLFDWQPDAH